MVTERCITTDGSGTLDIYEITAFSKKISGGAIDLKPQAFANDFKLKGKELTDKLAPHESVNILIDAACLGTLVLASVLEK